MNIVNILEEIEKVDGEIYERLNPRRAAMKSFANMGKKISLAAMPLAMGSMFQKAYGQTTPSVVTDVLNFALALEYLEYHFYNHALVAAPSLTFTAQQRTEITVIRDHEMAHVNLLKGALGASARAEITYAMTDYTAGNTFPTVYSDYVTFLKVALGFEDTGVRAYKGQAGNLLGNPVLTTALQIHSVEARHAAHIRTMLNAAGATGLKPWITLGPGNIGNDTGVAAVNAVYAGEENTTQAGINIAGIASQVTAAAAAECFDEPLAKANVAVIANLFLKDGFKLS
ncbi:ferritin-like domain-containing protein [Pedobacter sp. JCM 36344]|uniref:ferritin-like domain-containing protein n=1 Tax=Pedobacter sp. JCM 36344 TaxID=3374280 RepID=UPI00397C9E49